MSDADQPVSGEEGAALAMAGPGLDLREHTTARVGLARTGVSVATRPALEFSLAHAQARDAVHSGLAVASLMAALRERGLAAFAVRSAASGRNEYLRRPDLGRRLAEASAVQLATGAAKERGAGRWVSVILADGLSGLAVERHALPLLDALLPLLSRRDAGWSIAPVIVAEQGRVALGDEIGAALGADVTVMLIGERPGLSSPASLGAYITWAPRPGRNDAERNCVSNIHAQGLDHVAAAARIAWLLGECRRLGLSGVMLRESGMSRLGAPRS